MTCGTCKGSQLIVMPHENALEYARKQGRAYSKKVRAFNYGTYDMLKHHIHACPDCSHPEEQFFKQAEKIARLWHDQEGVGLIEMQILADLYLTWKNSTQENQCLSRMTQRK